MNKWHRHTQLQKIILFKQNRGFVNYYGPQRFGSGSCVQADQVGLALLKEKMVPVHIIYFYLMSLFVAFVAFVKKP